MELARVKLAASMQRVSLAAKRSIQAQRKRALRSHRMPFSRSGMAWMLLRPQARAVLFNREGRFATMKSLPPRMNIKLRWCLPACGILDTDRRFAQPRGSAQRLIAATGSPYATVQRPRLQKSIKARPVTTRAAKVPEEADRRSRRIQRL